MHSKNMSYMENNKMSVFMNLKDYVIVLVAGKN